MSRGGRRRGLSPEDRKLWEQVARTAKPLIKGRSERRSPAPPPGAAPAMAPAKPVIRPKAAAPSRVPASLHNDPPTPLGRSEAGLDRRTAERLRRGERAPDARIDLHGLTAERAHRRLDQFIGQAAARGCRVVLVITGKGGRRAHPEDAAFLRSGEGVLRQLVPGWLRAGPHAQGIIGIYSAHRRHGGDGALYVYLRKRR